MGPLTGIRVVEFAGVGPGPMAAMLLADLGATVLRLDRPEPVNLGLERPAEFHTLLRNRDSIALDLKDAAGAAAALDLVSEADALIEGFRPGVMERLGLGPDACLARNPRLVYGRITGWGQTGPLAQIAGHDLNYIAITGALNALGQAGKQPTIPLNLLGDFGGGALYLAFGLLAGVIEARSSGAGQVVDAAIVDGVMSMQTSLLGLWAAGLHSTERGTNAIDGGAHFYNVYECADGYWISVAPIEARFYETLLDVLGVASSAIGDHLDPENWPKGRTVLAERFRTKSVAEWCALFEGTDACVAPVLSWSQAQRHPHIRDREMLIEVGGVPQPAPAPRFSRTTLAKPTPARNRSAADIFTDWVGPRAAADLIAKGVIS
ncbi:CaiB/BaiF CoA transferase family protein [Achromobacter aegrifaciens]